MNEMPHPNSNLDKLRTNHCYPNPAAVITNISAEDLHMSSLFVNVAGKKNF